MTPSMKNFLSPKVKSSFNRPSKHKLCFPGTRLSVLYALLIWAWGGLSLHAQVLTNGADFLTLDSGARAEGMGGAFTGVADDVNALTWNPAGLALLNHPEAGYLHMIYISDIAYNFGGVALPLRSGENTWGLGLGVINLGTPSFDSTNGIAPSVSAGDNAFMASVAYRIQNIISFGVTGKYVMQNLAGYNANAFGADVGVLVTPGERFSFGAGVFNFGQQVKFISEADPLPTTGRIGVAYQILDLPPHSLLLSLDNGYDFSANLYEGAVGAEYWYNKTLALRVGYTGDSYQQRITAGLGLNLNLAELDYAYAPMGTLGDTQRLSLLIRFGTEGGDLIPPSGFTAHSLNEALSLSWRPSVSPEVVGYNLYLKRPGTGSFTLVTAHPLHDLRVKFGHLKNGFNYNFGITSVSAAGRESSMAQLTGTPGETAVALPAPTGFKAAPEGTGLNLSWDKASASEVTGFNLYLADSQGMPLKKLTAQPIQDTQVVLKSVDPLKIYRFLLKSVDGQGNESAPSTLLKAELSDLIKAQQEALLIPSRFRIVGGDALAHLYWSAVPGVLGYNLYVSNDGKSFQLLTKNGPKNVTQVILKPLHNGQTYYFAVTSVTLTHQESPKTIQPIVPGASNNHP
jgi:hypothetical protein